MKQAIVMLYCLIAAAFTANAQPAHSVTLTWNWTQGSGGLATNFVVYRGAATGTTCPATSTFTQIATVPNMPPLTYVDATSITNVLTEGATYCYAVTATDSAGASPDSNVASATIPFSIPVAPVLSPPVAK
jgi:hypothetical protein